MSSKRIFGLIGYPLSHSFSQKYFSAKFLREHIEDAEYRNFPLQNISEFKTLIASEPNLCGLNVTIPYKLPVMEFLDETDPEAIAVGAVNVIRFNRSEHGLLLKGFNSDVIGFRTSLLPLLPTRSEGMKALVLGSGGASRAIVYTLKSMGIEPHIVSRNKGEHVYKTYAQLTPRDITDHLLIINTTPLGMFPRTETFPVLPYQTITPGHILFDLVYNPQETQFLKWGKTFGAKTRNGLEMLHVQAEKSWEIWG